MILIETIKYNPDFLFHCVPSPDHPHRGLDLSQSRSFILAGADQPPHCVRIQPLRLSYDRPVEPIPRPAAPRIETRLRGLPPVELPSMFR